MALGACVEVKVPVEVAVKVTGVFVGVLVGVSVEVIDVFVGVLVGVSVEVIGVFVGVFVGVSVDTVVVFVGVLVGVSVVEVGVFVGVSVGVAVGPVGVFVGVAVGDWQKVDTVAGAVPPPEVSNSSVPKSPLVLMLKDALAFNWKALLAMGVPFSSKVHVPGPVIFEPVLVITNTPWASGVQLAESDIVGGTGVGVAVGDWQKVDTVAGAAPPPEASNSSVPKRPLVLMARDAASIQLKAIAGNGSAVQQ